MAPTTFYYSYEVERYCLYGVYDYYLYHMNFEWTKSPQFLSLALTLSHCE